MQQVEVIVFGYLCHPRGERQVVRRIFEQRISRDFNLMEADVPLRSDEPDRLRVRNEMDLVSALREFQPELSGDDAAAAVSRITRDADLHEVFRSDCECSTIG